MYVTACAAAVQPLSCFGEWRVACLAHPHPVALYHRNIDCCFAFVFVDTQLTHDRTFAIRHSPSRMPRGPGHGHACLRSTLSKYSTFRWMLTCSRAGPSRTQGAGRQAVGRRAPACVRGGGVGRRVARERRGLGAQIDVVKSSRNARAARPTDGRRTAMIVAWR